MAKLSPTRGAYDLAGVQGAAGPVQFFGALACLASVLVAAVTFTHDPFTWYSISFMVVAHTLSAFLRSGVPAVRARLWIGGIALAAALAITLVIPPLNQAAITPDMRQDQDFQLAGILMWIGLGGQFFASAPGVMLFLLLPQLASMAVFSQLNMGVQMPACYALYLASALALLAYANFIRRPVGTQPKRQIVLPRIRDMMFSVSMLFVLLAVGGGVLAIVVQIIVPSAMSRDWFSSYFFQSGSSGAAAYDEFSSELDMGAPSGTTRTAPVLAVTGDEKMLLRRRVYVNYTGHGWLPSQRVNRRLWVPGSRDVHANEAKGTPIDGVPRQQELILLQRLVGSIPVAGFVRSVDVPPGMWLRVDENGIVWASGSLERGLVIKSDAIECPGELSMIDDATAAFPAWAIDPVYLQVPSEAMELSDLAKELTRDHPSVVGKIRAIEEHLEKEYVYNLDADTSDPERDAVTDFLLHRREGICTDFASSLAILCRLSGIPTRLVTGYMAHEPDLERPGHLIARENDAHAWVEAFIPGTGWATFDPQADRETTGNGLERAMATFRYWWAGFSRTVAANILVLALLVPLGYIIVYQVRRQPRGAADHIRGSAPLLRDLMHALQLVIGWRSPGATPREHLTEAKRLLPPDLYTDVASVMGALVEMCYAREEPGPSDLAAQARRARSAIWRVRHLALKRWIEAVREQRRARRERRSNPPEATPSR